VAVLPEFHQDALLAADAVESALTDSSGVAVAQESLVTEVYEDSSPASSRIETRSASDAAAERLASVAGMISEDICVMSATSQGWVLSGVCVAFPSHWNPVSKLGSNLDGIHAPVPGYPRIAGASHASFDRIANQWADRPRPVWERFNWTVVTDDVLCHLDPATGPTAPPTPAQMWLRVERQSLAALSTGVVVFLIRTFLTPLTSLTSDERLALAESMTGVSPELAKYRNWVGYGEVVSRWLRSSS
jgi:dimethylamine monooxygenase subunit A